MVNNKKRVFFLAAIVLFWLATYIWGCASMQSPTGGPKDSIPPGIVNEVPKNFTKNFTAKKIEIEFNEFVKLSNEYTEISISPAMDIPPVFKVKKENLEIEFKQELEANTTYSINFGKAIADVNESNILKNYSYVFSTGNEIDSLSISGKVINSLTKEKQKDVTVFILPVSQDSLFGKKKASVFNITDTAGTFKLSNLREDTYKLYALLEQGGDRIYNGQNEEIGFLQNPIKLTKDTSGIVLQVFKEYPNVFIVKDRRIEGDGRISLTFNRPIINPTINIIEPASIDQNKTVEFSLTRDSATIWIPELNFDSIDVVVNSAGKALDTVTLRRNKRDTYIKSLVASDNLSGSKIRPGSELILKLSSPIQSYQESQITLLEDSIPAKGYQIVKDPNSLRTYSLKYPWKLKKQYILKLAENAFTDVLGTKSKVYSKKFELDIDDNYGSISINVSVPDTTKTYLVQWLNERKEILKQNSIKKNTLLNYIRYPTAKYLIRVIYDDNDNGEWDTGNVKEGRQPEKTWNFDKTISLRPN
ncbi:MAG: Ig-like domain-containing protein, partial [Pedobacter sp.]|nr:Ig-like domain-containing protein [Pedobacter sp.]